MKLILAVVLAAWTPLCGLSKEIDRVLASVNNRVITLSDLQLARKLTAVLEPGGNKHPESSREEIDRLVEQEILRQELSNIPAVQAEDSEIEPKIAELRESFEAVGGLAAALKDHGLLESELRSFIAFQISVEKFIRFRFLPFVSVDPEETRAYYDERLVPQLKSAPGSRIPPFEEVSAKIEEILTEEKVNSSVDKWIQSVRSHARIEYFQAPGEAAGGSGS